MNPTAADTATALRVLLVEDEFLIAECVAETLSDHGFAVQTASNGAEALRYLAAARFDALFTDINLPGGIDGVELAQRARALRPYLPVVYGSARAAPPGEGARVPGAVFLRKPYELDAVGRLLASLVRPARVAVPA